MMSIIMPSVVAVMLCFGLIIIRNSFNACKKLAIYTDIYDIQLHFQNLMWANNNWMAGCIWPAGCRLDAPLVIEMLKTEATILAKSPGTLRKFLMFSQHSSPLPPNTILVFRRRTSGNGKIFLYNNAMYLRNRPTLFWGGRGVRGSYNT